MTLPRLPRSGPLLVAVVLLVTCGAASASAAGLNLAWSECLGAGGLPNRSFACNTNAGSSILVASFDPPSGITRLIGGSATIDLATPIPLPPWWQLGPGGCREGALHLDFAPAPGQGCVDYWSASATGSYSYQAGFGQPRVARIRLSWGIPEALGGAVYPGTEYYAFRLVINNSKTVGSDFCSDCLLPACMVLRSVWLYQPPGLGDHLICEPLISHAAFFQGGNVPGCSGADYQPPPPPDCAATPVIRRTWGLIKGLYR